MKIGQAKATLVQGQLSYGNTTYDDEEYSCVPICWYNYVTEAPDPDYLDVILWHAHLIPVFSCYVTHSLNLTHDNYLDAFHAYYVNKYTDHHMNEIVF